LLNTHERVFVPDCKELHFFDDRYGRFNYGPRWYAAHFENAPRDSICGEASPSYLFIPGTARRIHDLVPEAKLLAILRDPVARAWSHYWYNVSLGREILSFEKAIAREEDRTSGPDPQPRWFSYLARGDYVAQLRRFASVFPRDQLCVVLFE